MILGMSVGVFTLVHVIITLVAIGSGLIVAGGMFAWSIAASYDTARGAPGSCSRLRALEGRVRSAE
jgi:hypothetical protein